MYIKQNIITLSLYFLITIITIELMSDPNQAILIWPATGVGIIAALIWRIKILPALYLAELLISLYLFPDALTHYQLIDFLKANFLISASLLRCYLGAFLIRYFIGYPISLISYQPILKLFFVVGPLTTFVSSIYYGFIKYVLGFQQLNIFTSNFFDWWFGDLLGFIIFAPLTMILLAQPKSIWKPRYLTCGLPVIMIFLTVIFIYNQSYKNEQNKLIENFEIKAEIFSTKLNDANNWFDSFVNYSISHFLPRENDINDILNYFNSIKDNPFGPNALAWFYLEESDVIRISQKFNSKKFDLIKNYNFQKLLEEFRGSELPLTATRYIQDIEQFVNVIKIVKGGEVLTIIVIHDFDKILNHFVSQYSLENTEITLELQGKSNPLKVFSPLDSQLLSSIQVNKDSLFYDESMPLIMKPTTNYFSQSIARTSSLLAQIGFLFAGLIGIMLLIITGKTTFLDIRVKERTLDLDRQKKDLMDSKEQYQQLIEQHPVILWRQNVNKKKMSYISKKVESAYGYPLQDWLKNENFWLNHIHKDDRNKIKTKIVKSLKNKKSFELDYRFITANDSIVWINDAINITKDQQGNIQLVGLMIDVSETKEAIYGQNISESKYRTLFKHAVDPLIIVDLETQIIIDSNDKAILLFGLDKENNQINLADLSTKTQPDGGNSRMLLSKKLNTLMQSQSINFDWTLINSNNKTIICNIDVVKLPNQTNNIILVNINDITEIRQHEKKINQLAYYDNLTKLPNRSYFYSKFEYFHERAKQENKYGTVIYLDLDRFKILNDSLGHQAGDILLEMVAKRIRKVTRKHDFCARLGGDEFIILTKKLENTIENILEKTLVKSELILEALNEPYQLGDYEHLITPSIGISYFPMSNVNSDQIIHQADIAMYASKNKGKNTITIYKDSMVKLVNERLQIEKAVRQALDNNEFELYYQPQYDINDAIFSVEALLRWQRSDEFNINTEDIISTIEKIGLTHDLGYWVFDQACAQLEKWQKLGHSVQSVSINVSAKQFHQKLFVEQVKSVIDNYNLSPSQIIIELTEAVIIDDMVSLIKKLSSLRHYGVRTSLDDFGTGYSSLAYLKHLPIDQLKIDKMFVHDLFFDDTSQHIVKTIIDLAEALNIELIAEGVEIKQQFELLKNLGCKKFQGFYFSEALNADKIIHS
ncbi:MAG: EAL domain-containing protein [Marinicellaceae bacterium]